MERTMSSSLSLLWSWSLLLLLVGVRGGEAAADSPVSSVLPIHTTTTTTSASHNNNHHNNRTTDWIPNQAQARSLQTTTCYTTDLTFSTPFRDNGNDEDPGVESLIFYIETREDAVEIQTLELDIRLHRYDPNGLTAHTDLNVQVFVTDQLYHINPGNLLNKESAWQRVADTQLLPNPDNERAVIPTADFTAFTIPGNNRRRAVWVRLRSGRTWIDYTQRLNAPALEQASANGHLEIFSGHGVTVQELSPNQDAFDDTVLNQLDRSIDGAIFAGTFRYRAVTPCDNDDDNDATPLFIETSVEFVLVVDQILANEDYGNIEVGMDSLLELLLGEDATLQSYATEFGLQRARQSSSFARSFSGGVCPWTRCLNCVTKVFVKHYATLDARRVQGQLYQYTERIAANIAAFFPSNSRVYNVGMKGVSAPFQLTLNGVSGARTSNSLLDAVQLAFVATYTMEFLTRHLDPTLARVYEFSVQEQIVTTRRQRGLRASGEPRGLQTNSLQLTGTLIAAQFATDTPEQFQSHIDSVFANYSATEYPLGLEYNLGLPGDIQTNNRQAYFEDLSTVDHVLDISGLEPPPPFENETDTGADDDDDDDEEEESITDQLGGIDMQYIYIAAGVAGGLLAICVVIFILRCFCDCIRCGKSKEQKEIDKMYQEEEELNQRALNLKRQREMERKEKRELKELKLQERKERQRKEKEERRRKREQKSPTEDKTKSTVPDTLYLSSQEGSWNDEMEQPPPNSSMGRRGPPGPQPYKQPASHVEPPRRPVAPPPSSRPPVQQSASRGWGGPPPPPAAANLYGGGAAPPSTRNLYGGTNSSSRNFDMSDRSGHLSGHFDASERSGHFNDHSGRFQPQGSSRFQDHSGRFQDHSGRFQDHSGRFQDHSGRFQDPSESYNYGGGGGGLVETRPDQHPTYRGRASQSAPTSSGPLPEYSLATLRKMPIPKLRHILRENNVQYDLADATEKEDLVQILAKSGKIRVLPEPASADSHPYAQHTRRRESVNAHAHLQKHPSYTLSQLRSMTEGQLRLMLEEYHVPYNPMQIRENEDLIRILVTSGKIILLAEEGAARRLSSGRLSMGSSAAASRRPSAGRLSASSHHPSYRLSELRSKSIAELRGILKQLNVSYDLAEVSEKEDLVRILCQSGTIVLLAEEGGARIRRLSTIGMGSGAIGPQASGPPPGSPSYTLSQLRASPIAKLRQMLKENDISYDMADVSEKEDLVRILCQSGKLNLTTEDGRPLRHASSGPMPYRNNSSGSLQYDHSQHGSQHGSLQGSQHGSIRGFGGNPSYSRQGSLRSFGSNNNLGLGGSESHHSHNDLYYNPTPPSARPTPPPPAPQTAQPTTSKKKSRKSKSSSGKKGKRKKLKPRNQGSSDLD